jgi:hypothetical protein
MHGITCEAFHKGLIMYHDRIKIAQGILRRLAGYTGEIDGNPGLKSLEAAARVPGRDLAPFAIWTPERKVIAAAQLCLRELGFDVGAIDGLYGSATDAAHDAWRASLKGDLLPDRRPEDTFGSEGDMIRRFGQPGSPICTSGRVVMPWDTVLAWDPRQKIKFFACHADVADSAQRVLENVAGIYSAAEIQSLGLDQFAGCFNYRVKRGGNTLSTHAFGVAIDWDSARNRLKWNAPRARLSHADAAPFWDAWAAERWTSLGRARDFDWMHVQAPAH